MQDRAGYTDNLSSVLLAVFLFVVLLLFGMGMFGLSFGEEFEQPAVNMTEAKSIILNPVSGWQACVRGGINYYGGREEGAARQCQDRPNRNGCAGLNL